MTDLRPDPTDRRRVDRRDDRYAEALTPVCGWARAQAAPLALGMLEPHEVDRVYDHLLLCPDCDEAVQRLVSVTSLLGLAVDQVEPPPSARRSLLARVARDAADRDANHRRRVRGVPLPSVPPLGALARSFPRPAAGRWLGPVAVLVLLLVGSFGIEGAFSSSDEVVQLKRENESMVAHLVSLSIGREKFGSDALFYPLMAIHAGETGGSGVLLGDPSEPRASLSLWNLNDRPGEYSVTVENTDGTRAAAGAVTIDQRGSGSLDLSLFQPIVRYRVVHVSTTADPDVDVFTLRLDEGLDLVEQLGD